MKKFELTEETKEVCGITLHRIKAVISFGDVQEGELGGFVESEENLSQHGGAWVSDDARVSGNAQVYGNARVSDDARVSGNAQVYGNAWVFGNSRVYGNARVSDDARVYGNARVSDDAQVYGNAWVYGNARVSVDARVSGNEDYIVFKNWWSSGRYFTWTRSNDMWCAGCFYGTGKELVEKAYRDSEKSGREYQRIVDYVEEVKKDK